MRFHFTAMLFHTLWEGWDFPPPLVGQHGLIQQLQPERALSPLLSQRDMGVAAAGQERAAPRTLRRRRRRRHKLSSIPSPLQILERLNKMCGVGEQMRKKQQRLLKNMDAHKVMLDLLQIPYDKVTRRPTQFMLGWYHSPRGQPQLPRCRFRSSAPTCSFKSTSIAPRSLTSPLLVALGIKPRALLTQSKHSLPEPHNP